jgi:hypothetical protein
MVPQLCSLWPNHSMNCAVPAPHALGKLYQMLFLMMTLIGVIAKYILLFLYSHKCASQESIVNKGTRLWAVWSRVHIPARARDLSLLQNIQTASGAHPPSYSMGTGVHWWGYDAYHSPQSSVEVKKEGSYTSTPPYVFMACIATVTDTFAFIYLCSFIQPFFWGI